jgi:hypothetical protein
MTLVACGREIPVSPELLRWLAASLGARGTWLVHVAFGSDRIRLAEIDAAIPALREAKRIRREELQTEFVRTNRLPKDAGVAAHVLATAMPKRLVRDALYQSVEQVLSLFADAHRAGESVACASYEECAALPPTPDRADED